MSIEEYEEYIANAKNSGILVGDRVQITRKAEPGENGWIGHWTLWKSKNIGEVGQVRWIDNVGDYYIEIDNVGVFLYPYFVLRLVHRMPIVPRFPHGDRVLIQRGWKRGENGTSVYFDKGVSDTIGKVGKIELVTLRGDNEFTYGVRFDDGQWWFYPEFVLKKSHKPNPDFEFEPFDTLLHITGPTLSR